MLDRLLFLKSHLLTFLGGALNELLNCRIYALDVPSIINGSRIVVSDVPLHKRLSVNYAEIVRELFECNLTSADFLRTLNLCNSYPHNFETYELCVIVYKPLCFLFEVQLEDKKYYAPRNYHQHYEVIGNIYENHELLERII